MASDVRPKKALAITYLRRQRADAPSFGGALYAITLRRACATLREGDQVAHGGIAIKLLAREHPLFQLLRGSVTLEQRLDAGGGAIALVLGLSA
jgi:hypothetical protein